MKLRYTYEIQTHPDHFQWRVFFDSELVREGVAFSAAEVRINIDDCVNDDISSRLGELSQPIPEVSLFGSSSSKPKSFVYCRHRRP